MSTSDEPPTGRAVLVHGAWHGAWCWRGVIEELNDRGIGVTAVELPFTGFADDVAAARAAIVDAGPGCVVVGHSLGGLVVSRAAHDLAGVRRLIYLAAFMLDVGEDAATTMATHGSELLGAVVVDDGRVAVDPGRAADLFYGDCDEESAGAAVARLRPMALDVLATEHPPAWHDVASTYVVCTADRAIPEAAQREMARRAAEVVEWPTDHSPFLTRPRAVADLVADHL